MRYLQSISNRLVHYARSAHWPGFKRVSLYDVMRFVWREAQKNDITSRSYSIAYTFFISLFPAVLVTFTVIPYLPIYPDIEQAVESYITDLLPGASAQTAIDFIRDIGSRGRGGLLSFSFFLAVYFSGNGMMAMMRSFEIRCIRPQRA